MQDDDARDNWDRFEREAKRYGYAPKSPDIIKVEKKVELDVDWYMKQYPQMFEPKPAVKPAPDWSAVTEFENRIAKFFGAPYAVAVDSATHGIELCLRYKGFNYLVSPKRTYVSVPMLANKLGIPLVWSDKEWNGFYGISSGVFDAATYWEKNGFTHGFMCISFQYQKHLSLGRGGMILCQDKVCALELKMMSYDGRLPGIPWREQNIGTHGFHYYMTPETAQLGLDKLDAAIAKPPRQWSYLDYPDLTQMDVFKR